MTMKKANSKNYSVSIKNEIVRVAKSRQLTASEHKIIKLGISRIQQQSKNGDWDDIRKISYSIDDFCDVFAVKKRGYIKLLRSDIKKLQGFGLELIRINDTTNKIVSEAYLTLFPYIEITDDNQIHLHFNEMLERYFYNLTGGGGFFKLGYSEIFNLSSGHAIDVYELLKSHLNQTNKECTYTVVSLRKALGISDDDYSRFYDFQRRVIDMAKNQIKNNPSALFDFDTYFITAPQPRGKPKVVAIKFAILPRVAESPMANPPLRPTSELILPSIGDSCPLCQQGILRKNKNRKTKAYFLGCSRRSCKYTYTMLPAEFDPAHKQTEFIPVADESATIETDIELSETSKKLTESIAKMLKRREKSENRQA